MRGCSAHGLVIADMLLFAYNSHSSAALYRSGFFDTQASRMHDQKRIRNTKAELTCARFDITMGKVQMYYQGQQRRLQHNYTWRVHFTGQRLPARTQHVSVGSSRLRTDGTLIKNWVYREHTRCIQSVDVQRVMKRSHDESIAKLMI